MTRIFCWKNLVQRKIITGNHTLRSHPIFMAILTIKYNFSACKHHHKYLFKTFHRSKIKIYSKAILFTSFYLFFLSLMKSFFTISETVDNLKLESINMFLFKRIIIENIGRKRLENQERNDKKANRKKFSNSYKYRYKRKASYDKC